MLMLSDHIVLPRCTAPVFLSIILAAIGSLRAEEPIVPPAKNGAAEEAKVEVKKLTVGECIRISLEKQPRLAALQASIGSAQASQRGVSNAPFVVRLTGDHKIRKEQACTGVHAAEVELEQARHDVTQAVVWTYYSVVYAREQVKVAKDAIDFVDFYRDQVETIVKGKDGGNREINQITLNRLVARLAGGQALHIKAQAGYERARAALREAMGVDPAFTFEPADEILPDFAKIELKKDDVIGHALSRRGEIVMASLFSDVATLEAYAQWSIRIRYRAETFASGADIHSRVLPYGSKDGSYRPDSLGPEMPVQMVGSRTDRSEKAWQLVARSQAVTEKTKNLVTLEAESAWNEFHFAGLAMEASKRQADAGARNLSLLKEVAGDKVSTAATLQQLLEAQEEAAKGQATYNESVYSRISALANIERITAGGFTIKYPGR